MKKCILSVLALLCCLLSCFGLSACFSEKDSDVDDWRDYEAVGFTFVDRGTFMTPTEIKNNLIELQGEGFYLPRKYEGHTEWIIYREFLGNNADVRVAEIMRMKSDIKNYYAFVKWGYQVDGEWHDFDLSTCQNYIRENFTEGHYQKLNLVAVYKPIDYHINYYDLNNVLIHEETYNVDSSFPYVFYNPVTEYPGYECRWETKTGDQAVVDYNNLSDKDFYGHFSTKNFSITYQGLPSSAVNDNPDYYNVESQFTLKPVMCDGYNFLGWVDADGQSVTEIKSSTLGDLTLTAQFEPVTYTVSYTNITAEESAAWPQSYKVTDEDVTLPSLTKSGYQFIGWTDENDNTLTKIATGSFGNLTLIPKFVPNNYQITLIDDTVEQSQTVAYETDYTLPIPTRTGYDFTGWFDENDQQVTDNQGHSLAPYDHLGGAHYMAHWEIKHLTITYEANGGTPVAPLTQDYGTNFIEAATERSNFRFVGWYYNLTKYTSETPIYSSVTVTAKWIEDRSIATVEEFLAIADNSQGECHLVNDIDFQGATLTSIPVFSGILDGRGYALKNFILDNSTAEEYWGWVKINNGTIKNLSLVNALVGVTYATAMETSCGVIAGRNNGTISNCQLVSGSVTYTSTVWPDDNYSSNSTKNKKVNFGGLAGYNFGRVENCTVLMDLKGTFAGKVNKRYNLKAIYGVGGIVGRNEGDIVGCGIKATLDFDGGSWATSNMDVYCNQYFGGIVGIHTKGGIDNCYATIDFPYETKCQENVKYCHNYIYLGGLAGYIDQDAMLDNCQVSGTISNEGTAQETYLGGLVAYLNKGTVRTSYAAVDVILGTSGKAGGFVGHNAGIIRNCYSLGNISTVAVSSYLGGFTGYNDTNASIYGCIATGNLNSTVANNVGFMVGSNLGTLYKGYYLLTATKHVNGVYETTPETGIIGKYSGELWSSNFLVNELAWTSEHWIITVSENPLLPWEIGTVHNFETYVVEPTCEYSGFTIYSCQDCNRLFLADYREALGHDYQKKSEYPSSCLAGAYEIQECSHCHNERKVVTSEPTGHPENCLTVRYTEEATCTETGFVIYECSACHNSQIHVDLPAYGHSGFLKSETQAATCTVPGEAVYFCTRCLSDYTVEIPCVNHQWEMQTYQAPSCSPIYNDHGEITGYQETEGKEAGLYCTVCSLGVKTIEPHNWELVDTITAATCEATGSGNFECSICGQSLVRPIPQLTHQDANRDYLCDLCGTFILANTSLSDFTAIASVADLRAVNDNLMGWYVLTADLDLGSTNWTALGVFKGIFFGNGYVISGMNTNINLNSADSAMGGLFSGNQGLIIDVGLENISLTVNINAKNQSFELPEYVYGAVVARNLAQGRVINCRLLGENQINICASLLVDVSTKHMVKLNVKLGGLVGINAGQVENCVVAGTMAVQTTNLSRIAAVAWKDLPNHTLVTAVTNQIRERSATLDLYFTFGGLVGINQGVIKDCQVTATFDAKITVVETDLSKGSIEASTIWYAGSLVGYNAGDIENCEATTLTPKMSNQYWYLTIENLIGWVFRLNNSGESFNQNYNVLVYTDSDLSGIIGENYGNIRGN